MCEQSEPIFVLTSGSSGRQCAAMTPARTTLNHKVVELKDTPIFVLTSESSGRQCAALTPARTTTNIKVVELNDQPIFVLTSGSSGRQCAAMTPARKKRSCSGGNLRPDLKTQFIDENDPFKV